MSYQLTKRQTTLIIAILYGLLVIVMTWPLASQLASHIPGNFEREDIWTHQWTFWWVKQAILNGNNPLFTDLIFYPEGISLASHNIAWLNILFWLPLQAVFGQIAAYNLVFMTIFWLNALGAYFLVRELNDSLAAAFTAGVVFGFWPYTLSHFDHPNLILVAWVPLALLFLHRTLQEGRRRDMMLTTLFILLIGYTRWQLLIPSAVVIGFYLLWQLAAEPSYRSRKTVKRLIQILLFSAILFLPLAWPIIMQQLTLGDVEPLLYEHLTDGQTDLLAYFLPSRYHPIWGEAVQSSRIFNSFIYNQLYIPFIGFVTLALSIIGLVYYKRRVLVWAVMALLLFLLALGPLLRIGGELFPQIPMPYRLVEELYFFRLLRRPDRFNILLGLPLAILAGFGLEAIRKRLPGRYAAGIATVTLIALILLETSMLPFPTTRVDGAPSWYGQLAKDPERYAIVEIPLERVAYKLYMYWQTFHAKPTVQGRISRVPMEAYDTIDSVPILEYMRENQDVDERQGDVTRQLDLLAEMDVRFVVLHKHLILPEQISKWRNWFVVEPVYEDEVMAVFGTDPTFGRDYAFQDELIGGLGIISAGLESTNAVAGEELVAKIVWGTNDSPSADYQVCFIIESDSVDKPAVGCQSLAAAWPTSEWDNNEVIRVYYEIPLPGDLQPDSYRLSMQLKDVSTGELIGTQINLGQVNIDVDS